MFGCTCYPVLAGWDASRSDCNSRTILEQRQWLGLWFKVEFYYYYFLPPVSFMASRRISLFYIYFPRSLPLFIRLILCRPLQKSTSILCLSVSYFPLQPLQLRRCFSCPIRRVTGLPASATTRRNYFYGPRLLKGPLEIKWITCT